MNFRKSLKILLLIFVLSINTIAAVISDNDGAAFVTNELSEEIIQFNFSNVKNRQGCDTF